jgi:regulator of PEP synthase PpsR (kinase-PPPase family)
LVLWILGIGAPCLSFAGLNLGRRLATPRVASSSAAFPRCPQPVENTIPMSARLRGQYAVVGAESHAELVRQSLPWFMPDVIHMTRLHLHLLSDSTGETLEMIAKAALAQFDGAEVIRHFWPMVRSQHHLDRIIGELAANPGLVLHTLVNADIRVRLEERCLVLGLPHVPVLDAVTAALEDRLGQEAHGRPGRQHVMDAAYFARVDAIQFTIAHDDGIGWENWEQADIVLAGVSRTSKTPTSIYLANRGYKVANIPLVVESPPPPSLFELRGPMVVGLTTAPKRLIEIRRNRLLSLNETTETAYVDEDKVEKEVAFARRLFADNGWPVIDVSRRSIEETAAGIMRLLEERETVSPDTEMGLKPI